MCEIGFFHSGQTEDMWVILRSGFGASSGLINVNQDQGGYYLCQK